MFDTLKWTRLSMERNAISNYFETVQPFVFCEYIKQISCEVLLDIGANVGLYTVIASKIPSIEKIYSFEPEEIAYQNLVYNIHLNEMESVAEPINLAVSNEIKNVSFGIEAPAAGINGIIETSFHDSVKYNRSADVLAISVDDIVAFLDKRIGIKIDVEGHEIEVLQGCRQILDNNQCLLQVEIYKDYDRVEKVFLEKNYQKIFNIANDFYFTNIENLRKERSNLQIIELALSNLVKSRRSAS